METVLDLSRSLFPKGFDMEENRDNEQSIYNRVKRIEEKIDRILSLLENTSIVNVPLGPQFNIVNTPVGGIPFFIPQFSIVEEQKSCPCSPNGKHQSLF